MNRQERIDRTERGSLKAHLDRALEHTTALRDRSNGPSCDDYQAIAGLISYALERLESEA